MSLPHSPILGVEPPPPGFARLAADAAQLAGAAAGAVTIFAGGEPHLLAGAGLPPDEAGAALPALPGWTRRVVEQGQALAVDDAGPAAGGGWRAFLGVPLHVPSGRPEAALWVADPAPRAWAARDRAALEALARAGGAELAAWREARRLRAVEASDRAGLETQVRTSSRLEAVGRLAGGVAHDFNNLLMVVAGNLELLHGRLEREGVACEELEEVEQALARATALNRQLLALGRTRPRGAPRRLELGAHLAGLVTLLQRLIGEDVALVVDLAPEPLEVSIDPAQLEQVVINLVVNARDAVREAMREAARDARRGDAGRQENLIELTLHPLHVGARGAEGGDLPPGEYVVLAVRDTGAGMDAATQARVFEPFFTTKPRDEGTGLGLATVHGVARQARGAVRVHSAPGEGSRFEVLPPRAGAPPTPAPAPPAAAVATPGARAAGRAAARAAAPRGHETVLLVEDEQAVRATMRRMLERLGYEVLEARHGAEAVARLEEDGSVARGGRIALVLSDVVMPEMGAERLLERLRAEWPRLPVLLMSGYSETAARDGLPRAPGDDAPRPFDGVELLEKPIEAQVLASRLRAVLEAPR